jgi:hypothetical protein
MEARVAASVAQRRMQTNVLGAGLVIQGLVMSD